jgi:hypothetical protein
MLHPQGFVTAFIGALISIPTFAGPNEPAVAQSSIPFLDTLTEAMAKAQPEKKRILVFFSGEGCGPCQKHEQLTHTDSRVVSLAKKCVCVKLKTDTAGEVLDRYNVSSIPRTLILDADGRLISEQVGFQEADEHVRWIRATFSASAPQKQTEPRQPFNAVGADADKADLLIWFLEQENEEFKNAERQRHTELLAGLEKLGLSPRIEHVYRSEFVNLLREQKHSPDLIASRYYSGYLRQTYHESRLTLLLSSRLQWPNRQSPISDFERHFVWTRTDWEQIPSLKKAIDWLLKPEGDPEAGQTHQFTQADAEELVRTAKEMTLAHQTGDLELMARHWSEHALQKSPDFVDEPEYRQRRHVKVGPVQLFGQNQFAVALVEVGFATERGQDHGPQVGSSTACVVLHRSSSKWKVFNIRTWYFSLTNQDLDALCALKFESEPAAPRNIRLTSPANNSNVLESNPALTWELEPKSPAPLIQVVEILVNPGDRQNWPTNLLHFIPPTEPAHLKYAFQQSCQWRVWTIERDGTLSFSPVHSFTVKPANPRPE